LSGLDAAQVVSEARHLEQSLTTLHAGFSDLQPFFPPCVVSQTSHEAFKQLVETLMVLFASLPQRLAVGQGFDGLLTRLGYSTRELGLIEPYCVEPWLELAAALTRFDFVLTKDGLKAVELNAAAGIGGLGLLECYDEAFSTTHFKSALDQQGIPLTYIQPIDSFLSLMRNLVRIHGSGPHEDRLRIALATLPRDLDLVTTWSCVRHLRTDESEIIPVSLFDVEVREEGAFVDGERIDVLWGCYSFEAEASVTQVKDKARDLLALAHQKQLIYLVPPVASLFGNKGLLSLITSERDDEMFSAAECQLIDQFIPWTARVTAENLPELLARQSQLVLKPSRGVSGLGVNFGSAVSVSAWHQGLKKIIASGMPFVAQSLCIPASQAVTPGAFDREKTTAAEFVFGGIAIAGRFSGNVVRAQPAASGKPINAGAGARYANCYYIIDMDSLGKAGLA
jgi:hypothetical protein